MQVFLPILLGYYLTLVQDAYKIFTIDKVLASLIKHVSLPLLSLSSSNMVSQVQSWEQDPKLEKIAKLLWDERLLETPTVEDHRRLRREAEEILGPEDNLFRIDWVRATHTHFMRWLI
jgi:paired amphipathic helix protein Sin3a